ncbi:MAG: molybdopterin-dependent oxidoreductase [Deltaproteobacteria bacterium]|nr:molybdopterin-dependent oxidoreductase [Deltaproteobacteria bacterium]
MNHKNPNARVFKTHCSRMDHGGCGLLVEVAEGRIKKIKGDPQCPISHGYICPKGLASFDRTIHPDRLTRPLLRQGARGEGRWKPLSWTEALHFIAESLNRIRRDHGPEAVVFAQGAPKGLEHFVLIRLANVFGSPNVCGPQHVCHMPREIAGQITCGFFPVPDYEVPTGLILNWGSNLLKTNEEGIIALRLLESIKKGADLIVVDPRKTHLASIAQSHLQIKPGSDIALALGLIHIIIREGLFNREFVDQWTVGFQELKAKVEAFSPEQVAELTWLTPEEITQTAWTYATSQPALIQWGNAVEHTVNSLQTCRALLCLMAITGNLDVPGGNIMPTMPPVARLADFVKAELLPDKAKRMLSRGFNLIPNFMIVPQPMVVQAILTQKPYPVRAMVAQVTNPLITTSDARRTYEALMRLELLVISECFMTPTAALADILLPAATGFEFDDIGHYGLSQGWISSRPKLVDPPGKSWPDLKILNELGKALGHAEHFWEDYHQALDEVLAPAGMDYEQFKKKGVLKGKEIYQKYEAKGFKTPSRKVELFSKQLQQWGFDPLPAFSELPRVSLEYPLLATSQKNPYYFHSSYRQISALRKKHPEPVMDIHPAAAGIIGLTEGDWALIITPKGRIEQKVHLSESLDPRVVFLDYGWWFPEEKAESLFDWDRSNLNILTAGEPFDPAMGTPNLRAFPCRIEKCPSIK